MFATVEALLVERLKAALPDVTVLTSAELAAVTEDRQPAPAVHVVYQHYRVLETRSDGTAARISTHWLVVVATRNAGGARSSEGARQDASVLAERTLAALMGYRIPGHKPLMLETPPRPAFSTGMMYLPLAFSLEHATTITGGGP